MANMWTYNNLSGTCSSGGYVVCIVWETVQAHIVLKIGYILTVHSVYASTRQQYKAGVVNVKVILAVPCPWVRWAAVTDASLHYWSAPAAPGAPSSHSAQCSLSPLCWGTCTGAEGTTPGQGAWSGQQIDLTLWIVVGVQSKNYQKQQCNLFYDSQISINTVIPSSLPSWACMQLVCAMSVHIIACVIILVRIHTRTYT